MPQIITNSGPLNWRQLQEANDEMQQNNIEEPTVTVPKDPLEGNTRWRDITVATSDFNPIVVDDYGKSRFDSRANTRSQLENLDEFRAQQQNNFNSLASGTGKALVLAGTTAVDAFAGTIGGILNFVAKLGTNESAGQAFNNFVNNPVSEWLQRVNQFSEDIMPNYYSRREQNMHWWQQAFNANFIGDHFIKNLGFWAGAYISGKAEAGLLTKAMGIGKTRELFAGAVQRATGSAERMAEKDAIRGLLKGELNITDDALAAQLTADAKKLKNANTLTKVTASITGAMGESRIEAITGADDYFNQSKELVDARFLQDTTNIDEAIAKDHPEWFTETGVWDNNGVLIDKIKVPKDKAKVDAEREKRLQELQRSYDSTIAELTKEKINYANTAFLMNMAVLASDYVFQFGDAWVGGFGKARSLKGLVELVDNKYKDASRREALKSVGSAFLGPVAEGTQEMFQEGIQKAATRWEADKLNKYYGEILNPEGLKATTDFLSTFVSSLGDVYTDPDEWENFALGFLTAFMPMPGRATRINKEGKAETRWQANGEFWNGIREAREARRQGALDTKALNEMLEDPKKREMFVNLGRQIIANQEKQGALITGDSKRYKDSEYAQFVSRGIAYLEAGRFQDFLNEIETIYTVNPENIDEIKTLTKNKETGESIYDGKTDAEIIESFNKQKEEALARANRIKEIAENIDRVYGNTFTREGYNTLTYYATTIDDREARIKQISSELIDSYNKIIKDVNKVSGRRLRLLKSINDLQVFFDNPKSKSLIDRLNTLREANAEEYKKELTKNAIKISQAKAKIAENAAAEEDTQDWIDHQNGKDVEDYKAVVEELTGVGADIHKYNANNASDDAIGIDTKIQDLISLLGERETLIESLNDIIANPEKFEEALSNDLTKAVNTYVDRVRDSEYQKLKGLSKEDVYSELIATPALSNPESLAYLKAKAKEEDNKDIQDAIESFESTIEELGRHLKAVSEYADDATYGTVAKEVNNRIQQIVLNTTSADEFTRQVTNYFSILKTRGEVEKDFVEIIEEAVKEAKAAKASSKTRPAKEGAKVNENITKLITSLLNARNKAYISQKINELSEDQARALASDPRIIGEISFDEGETLEDVSEKDLKDILIDIFEGFKRDKKTIEQLNQEADTESTDSNTSTEDGDDDSSDDSDEDSTEEEVKEGETTFSSENVDGKPSKAGKKVTTSGVHPPQIKIPGKKEIDGNREKDSQTGAAHPIEKETIAVNRGTAKYKIDNAKEEHRLIENDPGLPNNKKRWYTNTLDFHKVQEFIDSGELAEYLTMCKEAGVEPKIRFVQLRGQVGYPEGLTADAADYQKQKNAKLNDELFIAIELPEEYVSKHGNPQNAYQVGLDKKTKRVKMQLLGIVEWPTKTKETKDKIEHLNHVREEVQKQTHILVDSIPNKDEALKKYSVMLASTVETNIEWVFSGRMVKTNDKFTKVEKRPLSAIIERDKDGNYISQEGKLQIALVRDTDRSHDIVLGEDLGGELVPLNENRRLSPLNPNPMRAYTPWLRVKQADSRVYSTGLTIRKFDSSYTKDDSHYAKKIKEGIHKVVTGNTQKDINRGLSQIFSYLHVPKGKAFAVNYKEQTLRRGDEVVDLTSDTAEEDIYNLLKEQGYTFTFGTNEDYGTTLDNVIESDILETDLAQLQNANASLLISDVDVDKDGNVTIYPPSAVEQFIASGGIHTGNRAYDPSQSLGNPITFPDKTGVVYRQKGVGPEAKFYDVTNSDNPVEVTDEKTKFKIRFATQIAARNISSTGKFIPRKGQRGTSVYQMVDNSGKLRFMTSDYYLLTDKDVANFLKLINGNDKNGKAKEALEKAVGGVVEEGQAPEEPEAPKAPATAPTTPAPAAAKAPKPGMGRRGANPQKAVTGTDISAKAETALTSLAKNGAVRDAVKETLSKIAGPTALTTNDRIQAVAATFTADELQALNDVINSGDEKKIKTYLKTLESKKCTE